jgi:ATP-dependent RNA helicase RhlE
MYNNPRGGRPKGGSRSGGFASRGGRSTGGSRAKSTYSKSDSTPSQGSGFGYAASYGDRYGASQSNDRGGSSYGGSRGGSRGGSSRSFSGSRPYEGSSPAGARRSFSSGGARSGGFSRGGGSSYGGSRGGSRGGGRGGRRFVAPHLDIERFIEKSTRESAAHLAKVEAEPAHVVTNDFDALIVHPKLRAQVAAKGYKTPTPIQDKAIPHVQRQEDIVGIANTGTGKTAAFLIPLIDRALVHPKERTLVVVPTRELATQIGDELRGFATGLGIMGAVCIGGANIRAQIAQVERARFVIGTPGRLKDLIERRRLDMQSITSIVLDEADRMLDMGFINDIRFLFSQMPQQRHSLCFSATMSPEIQTLIGEFLKSPINVSVKTGTTSHSVEQNVVRITEGKSKFALLEELLRNPEFNKVLVFGETKHGVERLSKQLLAKGIRAESIHGNKSSGQRKRALDAFKSGFTKVLVATDVAARGLDITDVSHVINFDVPHSYEDYVHRIGRTGRGGAKGKAITFVDQGQ